MSDRSKIVIFGAEAACLPMDAVDLWHKVYCEELGWIPSLTLSYICDGFHRNCAYFVAYCRGVAAGTARVVWPVEGLLPCDKAAGTVKLPWSEENRVEITRLMVQEEFRKRTFDVFPQGIYRGLMMSMLDWCRRAKIDVVAMDVRAKEARHSIFRSLIDMGFQPTGIEYPDALGPQFPKCTTVIKRLSSDQAAHADAKAVGSL